MPHGGELYDLTATFTVAEIPETTRFHLYLPSLGQRTTLWVNGHALARDVDTSEAGPDIALDRGVLVAGLNRIQLIAVPFADGKNHIPDRTRLGAVQAFKAADPWQRHAFNGFAEVIVQATGEPGEITLTARSEGLESKPLVLKAGPAP